MRPTLVYSVLLLLLVCVLGASDVAADSTTASATAGNTEIIKNDGEHTTTGYKSRRIAVLAIVEVTNNKQADGPESSTTATWRSTSTTTPEPTTVTSASTTTTPKSTTTTITSAGSTTPSSTTSSDEEESETSAATTSELSTTSSFTTTKSDKKSEPATESSEEETTTAISTRKSDQSSMGGPGNKRSKAKRTIRSAPTQDLSYSAESSQGDETTFKIDPQPPPAAAFEEHDESGLLKLFMDMALKNGRPFSRYLIPRSVDSAKRKVMKRSRKKTKVYRKLHPDVRPYRDTKNPDLMKLSVLDIENVKGCIVGESSNKDDNRQKSTPSPPNEGQSKLIAKALATKRGGGDETQKKIDELMGSIEKMVEKDDIKPPERRELAEILAKLSKAYDSSVALAATSSKARSWSKSIGPKITNSIQAAAGDMNKYSSAHHVTSRLWKSLPTAPSTSSASTTTEERVTTRERRWFAFDDETPTFTASKQPTSTSPISKTEPSRGSTITYQVSHNEKKALNQMLQISRPSTGKQPTSTKASTYTVEPLLLEEFAESTSKKIEDTTSFGFQKLKFLDIDDISSAEATTKKSLLLPNTKDPVTNFLESRDLQEKQKPVLSTLDVKPTANPSAQMCKNLLGHIEGVLKQFITVLNKTSSRQTNATVAEVKKFQVQLSNQARRIFSVGSSSSSEKPHESRLLTSTTYYHRAKTMIVNDVGSTKGNPSSRTTHKPGSFYVLAGRPATASKSTPADSSSEDEPSTTTIRSRTTTPTSNKDNYKKLAWTMAKYMASDKKLKDEEAAETTTHSESATVRHDPKKLFNYIKAKYSLRTSTTTEDKQEDASGSGDNHSKQPTTEKKALKSAQPSRNNRYDGLQLYDDRQTPATTEDASQDETEDPVFAELKEFVKNTDAIRTKTRGQLSQIAGLDAVPDANHVDDWGLCSIFTEDWLRDWSLGMRRRSIDPREARLQHMQHCLEELVKKLKTTQAVSSAAAVTAYYIPVTMAGTNTERN